MGFIPDAVFEVNEPTIVSETIDGEAVIIKLTTGSYYSLRHSGVTIWSAIQRSARLSDIAEAIRASFVVGEASIEAEIGTLIDSMLEEELIRPATWTALSRGDGPLVPAGTSPIPFRAPILEKFTDMQALLLLDPVHDVDDEGWPDA